MNYKETRTAVWLLIILTEKKGANKNRANQLKKLNNERTQMNQMTLNDIFNE